MKFWEEKESRNVTLTVPFQQTRWKSMLQKEKEDFKIHSTIYTHITQIHIHISKYTVQSYICTHLYKV